ncbi:potassium/proton antiporter [Parvularcula dongshanensis]|uniref:Cell volume regulation protein A n=1 Tax=Parvularcula dongshanensis TaxID=1173995 RepID=A0A840I2P6_9PROT|nr:potassium/proton antiporter [Parvularcula dongshanensis]MBB4659276.1 cell volume regulation protein A [Parvularcula dongshanensis]
MDVGIIILAISALCVGAILAGAAGQKIDAPILLVFLLAGMLAGREGPGGISFDASQGVLVWGSAALAAILFEGGLRTEASAFRLGTKPGLSLALIGTIATAFLVTPFARQAFGLDWSAALLFGAIVSSTDAAAVFALAASGLKMPKRIVAALEVESGFNDPIAILLVVGLSISIATEPLSAGAWAFTLLAKLVVGALVGGATGIAVPRILQRLALPSGLISILTAGFGFMAFGAAEVLGGSGFLAIYLAGLTISTVAPKQAERVGGVMDGIAWLAQTGLFLLLGLLVTPSHLATVAAPALGVALALIFVARPLAVAGALAPFGFRQREVGFVAWVGLRGATPVYLGLLPAALGVPNGNLYLSAAAVVVLISLVIQGWTAPVVGQALRLSDEEERSPMSRGGALARIAAAAASIAVGGWFAVALQPPAAPSLVTVSTQEELRTALSDRTRVPATFPPGFAERPLEERRALFIDTITTVVEASNARIRSDRARLEALAEAEETRGRLTLEEEATVSAIARRYGLRFAEPAVLLGRIDIVPPRLAAAQAALSTGWGGSASAVEKNAVFGLDLKDGYPNLLAAARALTRLYASHEQFEDFRSVRAQTRVDGEEPSASALAPYVGPFASDSQAYVESVRSIVESAVFDEVEPTAEVAAPPEL